jgi:hypothetical protein
MKLSFGKALTLGLLGAGLACGSASEQELGASQLPLSICGQWDTYSVNNKEYVIQQNEWGGNFGQCLTVGNGTSFTVSSGNFTNSTSGAPATYPSIFKGCHWGNCTTNSGMPVQVSSLGSATSTWSVTTASGAYNISYDIWINSQPTTSGQPDSGELMIWLGRGSGNGTPQPAGSVVGTVTISGRSWQVWYYTGFGWPYVAYLATSNTTSATIDIKAFINDAVSRGYFRSSGYLVAIEAGFEIWNGGIGLTSNSFSASVTSGSSGTSYTLSVSRAGTGSGTVTSSPSGINCGSTCSASYGNGTNVTLTAAAASGSTFAGWSGACSGTGSCTVSMTAARSVTATFNAGGGGTGTACANPITITNGQSGNFNTTGAVCLRTGANVNGWGCSNFAGRTVALNGTTVSCGAMPQIPLAKLSDGYTYFSVSAGTYPWASLYYW